MSVDIHADRFPCSSYDVGCAVLAAFMWWYLKRENAKKDARNAQRGPWTAEDRAAQSEMGENADFFKYTL